MCDLVLFENALGFSLFKVVENDEIGNLVSQMQTSISDFGRVAKIIKLAEFVPFKTAEEALENCNSISEGAIPNTLKTFLEANVTKDKVLGITEDKLASSVQENLGLKVVRNKNILELTRGIRMHFHSFLKGINENDVVKAELGLGHSYSRSKVKFNVNKVDNMIIQAIFLLDQLEKDINTNSMRMREWYGWHFPELSRIVDDHGKYAQCIQIIGDRAKAHADDLLPKLEETLADAGKAGEIIEAIKTSTGYEISAFDMTSILAFASRVVHLANYRQDLQRYLAKKMTDIAPNLRALVGDVVGARLISHAGSLTNLAKYPASTVQILGAEKALFRALKTRGKTPKYGLIYHSSFIGRAGSKNKGRISRYLANKCSIASRIDSFTSAGTDVFGKILKEQVEERLKFYEDGTTPRKNIDCMKLASEEIVVPKEDVPMEAEKKSKKTPKKAEKKAKMEVEEEEKPKKKSPKKAEAKEVEEEAPKKKTPKKTPKKAEAKEMEVEEEAPKKKTPKKTPKKAKKEAEMDVEEEEEKPKSTPEKSKKKGEAQTAEKKKKKKVVSEESGEKRKSLPASLKKKKASKE